MKSRGPRKQVRATLQWERPAPAATAVTAVAARAGRPCASGQDARATSCPPTAPFSHFWFLWTHTPQARVCGALECGSLLPLSQPACWRRSTAVPRREIGALAKFREQARGRKAAASCRTLKLRRHAGREVVFPTWGHLPEQTILGEGADSAQLRTRRGRGARHAFFPAAGMLALMSTRRHWGWRPAAKSSDRFSPGRGFSQARLIMFWLPGSS